MNAHRTPRQAGFTLAELMTACALTALLAGVAVGIARDAEAASTATSREARELRALQEVVATLQDDLRRCGADAAARWSCAAGGGLSRLAPGAGTRCYDLPVDELTFTRDGGLTQATLTLAPRRAGRPGATVVVRAAPRAAADDEPWEGRR